MANRFQTNQYRAIYPLIAERDGEYCLCCFIETGQRRTPNAVKLQIDHADCDPHNWAPNNLHLVCKTHNLKLRSLSVKAHLSLMAGYSAENERVRMKENQHIAESKRKGLYLSGSPEMQVNARSLTLWREFMCGMIKANGSISKEDAITAGAIAADDVDIQTTARYLRKDCNAVNGRFRELKTDGLIMIVFREVEKVPRFSGNGHNGHKAIGETAEVIRNESKP